MKRLRGDAGVTLVELVVVAAIVAILSSVLYGILGGLLKARDQTEKIRDAETTAHYLFARITRELSSTSRTLTPLSTQKSSGSSLSGLSSSSGSALYLEGINRQNGEAPRDIIRFVSSNAAQPFVDGPANYGIVEIRYSLQDASEEEAARAGVDAQASGLDQKAMVFVREEVPAAVSNDETRKKRRIVLPLAGNVVALNFRYLKDRKWKTEWKEISPPLPEAVEITLGLRETDGRIAYYRTAIPMLPRNTARPAGTSSAALSTGR